MVGLPIRFGVITLDGGERPNQYYIIERVQHENGSRAQTNQTLTKRAPLRVPFLILNREAYRGGRPLKPGYKPFWRRRTAYDKRRDLLEHLRFGIAGRLARPCAARRGGHPRRNRTTDAGALRSPIRAAVSLATTSAAASSTASAEWT